MSGTPTGNKDHIENCQNYESKYIQSRAEFYKIHSKLVLLFKPSDSQVINLMDLLNNVRSALYDNPLQVTDELIDAVLAELQKVLKTEWETTKSRTWSKSS